MSTEENLGLPVTVGVGAIVFRDDDVLLVKRGKEPFIGRWSIPGGRLQFGETLEDGVRREVKEETGLDISLTHFLGVFEALPDVAGGAHMVLIDYVAEWTGGAPVAGDDAAEAAFVPVDEAMARLSWDKTRLALSRALEIRRSAAKSL